MGDRAFGVVYGDSDGNVLCVHLYGESVNLRWGMMGWGDDGLAKSDALLRLTHPTSDLGLGFGVGYADRAG